MASRFRPARYRRRVLIVWLALLAFAASPAAAASVTLEPSSGAAGERVTVRASGLEPNAVVEMRVGRRAPEQVAADDRGVLEVRPRIPERARGTVRVALRQLSGELAELGYRVASPFSGNRSAETSDWAGHLMRVTTNLDQGKLIARVALEGFDGGVSVSYSGRRLARTSGRAKAVRLRLPGDSSGKPVRARSGAVRLAARLQTPPAVLAAVGDIACAPREKPTKTTCRHADVAAITARYRPDAVALLGDIQYENGSLENFRRSFDRSWGQLEMPLRPVPGNHEYRIEGARDYFDYFEEQARWRPPSWYAYNLGSWHLVALNTNCNRPGVPCEAGGEQERWLRADLAQSDHRCTLAYQHNPRYSSGFHGSDTTLSPFWRALMDDEADLMLAGHDHDYERFGFQDENGQADLNGMRSFVVGTGGKEYTPLRTPRAPHSEFGLDTAYGVLILRLYERTYSWRFVRIDGRVMDFGNGTCL